ncbi:MAG: hypothetical protein DRJ35_07320 [Thermoprotei archaeon]|nr:MAG: hypothetical protein DRJ35_07320 [Thermoprotei archaeon]
MNALEKTFEAASPREGQITLDAGCGTGLLTTMLASRKAEVVAIDVSAGQLRQLRKKIRRHDNYYSLNPGRRNKTSNKR